MSSLQTYREHFPEQQEHLLHGEVWGVPTTELGHHGEEQERKGLFAVHRETCRDSHPEGCRAERHLRACRMLQLPSATRQL